MRARAERARAVLACTIIAHAPPLSADVPRFAAHGIARGDDGPALEIGHAPEPDAGADAPAAPKGSSKPLVLGA